MLVTAGESLQVSLYHSTGGSTPVPTGTARETAPVTVSTDYTVSEAAFGGTSLLQEGRTYQVVVSAGTTDGAWALNQRGETVAVAEHILKWVPSSRS